VEKLEVCEVMGDVFEDVCVRERAERAEREVVSCDVVVLTDESRGCSDRRGVEMCFGV